MGAAAQNDVKNVDVVVTMTGLTNYYKGKTVSSGIPCLNNSGDFTGSGAYAAGSGGAASQPEWMRTYVLTLLCDQADTAKILGLVAGNVATNTVEIEILAAAKSDASGYASDDYKKFTNCTCHSASWRPLSDGDEGLLTTPGNSANYVVATLSFSPQMLDTHTFRGTSQVIPGFVSK